jgi:hypothetical protein
VNAQATDEDAIAIGQSATAYETGVALGKDTLSRNGGAALGWQSKSWGGAAAGVNAQATNYATAFGFNASALYNYSGAIGSGIAADRAYQIKLGRADNHLTIPGRIYAMSNLFIGVDNMSAPSGLSAGLIATNGTAPTASAANASILYSAGGQWMYRGASDSTNNYLHNAGAHLGNLGGSDQALTTSYQNVIFGGGELNISLPSIGTYLVQAVVEASSTTAGDQIYIRLVNTTGGTYISPSEARGDAPVANYHYQISTFAIVTISSGSPTISVQAKNQTAARGSIHSATSKIFYVRLY